MGWNTWNKFGCNINEQLIKDTIDVFNKSGLIEAGYVYINLDDCWQISRDQETNIIKEDPEKFPSGIKALADYAHEKGLKLGIYSDAGEKTCAGRPGSLGYEKIDAETYAHWGIDYLKYDNCYNNNLPSKGRYTTMRDELLKQSHKIFYSICNWGEDNVTQWGKDVGNSWRTTGDIIDNWAMMLRIIDQNDQLYKSAGPGGWNDPDMLEVGNGGMTLTEYKTHFSLWAISKAPLIIGCDITQMSNDIKNILTNSEIIAINQDKLGEQGYKIKRTYVDLPEGLEPALSESDLEITNCNGKKVQKWYINDDGSIKNNNEEFCIEIPNCVPFDILVKTDVCHLNDKSYCSNSTNQEWIYDNNTLQIKSVFDPNKCLDLYNHTGPKIQTYQCDNSEMSQKWEYDEKEHTLKSILKNQCLASYINDEATEIWKGKLNDEAYAVLLVNRASINYKIEVTWKEIGFENKKAKLRDLWEKKDLGEFEDNYTVYLGSHDSMFLKVWPLEDEEEENKWWIIVLIAAGSAIFISIVLVIIFYFKMRNKVVVDDIRDNDKLIDSRA